LRCKNIIIFPNAPISGQNLPGKKLTLGPDLNEIS
jgi:hypothetical protein